MPAWAGRYAQRLTALTLAVYGRTCHLCLEPGATSADHVVTRSAGGSDAIENLRPAHKLCNSRRVVSSGSGAEKLPLLLRLFGV